MKLLLVLLQCTPLGWDTGPSQGLFSWVERGTARELSVSRARSRVERTNMRPQGPVPHWTMIMSCDNLAISAFHSIVQLVH